MPGKASKIQFSEKQMVILTEFSKSRSVPQFIRQRAKILCLAFDGQWNEAIAGVVGLERHQVGLWRRRWAAAWEALTLWECSEPLRLREAIRGGGAAGAIAVDDSLSETGDLRQHDRQHLERIVGNRRGG